jgi:tRNA (guanine37-N1)-methyltransferase
MPVLGESILKRAIGAKYIKVFVYDLRDYTNNKHKKIDARPYGGGPGMVLQAEPILRAHKKAKGRKKNVLTILLSPRGEQWTSNLAKQSLQKYSDIIFICGHYEGIDVRVENILRPLKISIGPFIVTGGELPCLLIIDSISRFVPGVLGNEKSLEESRISTDRIYTRPEILRWGKRTHPTPTVLLSGDHTMIERWRQKSG